MAIHVNCPACGASLSVSETTRRTTCDFCGNHFDVDTTQTEPALKRITPEEMIADPIPVQSAQTESVLPEPEPVIIPPPTPPFARKDPPPYEPVTPKRNLTWVVIAIIVALLACGGCSMMALLRLVQNSM